MGGGGRRGEEADGDEAEEGGEEGGEDGVALGKDGGQVGVDEGGIPEDGDEGAGGDAGDGGGGGGARPVEGGEDDRGQGGGVDGVGVEGFLEDGFGMEALVEGPEAEGGDHEAADEEDLAVGGLGAEVADEEVVDEVGGGGEEVVVGGGDDLGEDGADEEAPRRVRMGPPSWKPCRPEKARISRGCSWTSPVGKSAEPVTAMATMMDSSMTVPTIHPPTARVASCSDFAEKNFWYMLWFPSMRRQVGRKSSRAWRIGEVAEDLESGWGAGQAWTFDQPPARWMRTGSAKIMVKVVRRPMATSM